MPEQDKQSNPWRRMMMMMYLSEEKNSDLCLLHDKLIGFYNRVEKCLQRGTDWIFKLSRSENKQQLVPLTA
jgi:hypothetical protein